MRTINELLIILRDNARVKKSWFGLKQRIDYGLCYEIDYLYENFFFDSSKIHIDNREAMLLLDYLYQNRPDKAITYGMYWPPYKWKPRLKWLNEQIELTK